MRASTRFLLLVSLLGAAFGVAVTLLAYAGLRPAAYLALPGGLVDLEVNTPYHPSARLAAAVNAPLYALLTVGVDAFARRWRGSSSRAT